MAEMWCVPVKVIMADAYQVLKRGGVPDDRIVVMMYDDIVNDPGNPYPGQLFNKPGGPGGLPLLRTCL